MSNSPLQSGQALVARLKTYLLALNQSHNMGTHVSMYAVHSLRRGGIIAAWVANLPRDMLKLHGRWRSDALDAYLEDHITLRLKVTKGEIA